MLRPLTSRTMCLLPPMRFTLYQLFLQFHDFEITLRRHSPSVASLNHPSVLRAAFQSKRPDVREPSGSRYRNVSLHADRAHRFKGTINWNICSQCSLDLCFQSRSHPDHGEKEEGEAGDNRHMASSSIQTSNQS